MRATSLRGGFSLVLAVSLAACSSGGGGGGGADAGDLQARVLWQQPEDDEAATSGATSGGGFGTDLPAAVRVVRFDFASDGGESCCVAVDPRDIPIDPDIGQRRIVLKRLPAGPGALTVAGFPGDSAATPIGNPDTCSIDPAAAAQSCVRGLIDTPSFLSAPQSVTVMGGAVVDAGDIEVPALPFVIPGSLDPAPDGDAVAPLRVRARLGIAAGEIPESSVFVAVSPEGELAVTTDPCDDRGANPCSPGGELDVSGFVVESAATSPGIGDSEVRIEASSADGGALRLSYEVAVVSVLPTPTARVSATPAEATPTSANPTSTPEPTVTARTEVTRPPASSTPTRTPVTPFATPTGPTASPTATPDVMCSAQPRSGCRRPIAANQSILVLARSGSGGSNDSFLFRWENGDFTQTRDFGDPGLNTSYAICLYDGVNGQPVLRRQFFVPPGPDCPSTSCWRFTDDGWRYTDPGASSDGITAIDLNAGLPGSASILVSGAGPNLALPSLPLSQQQSVIVQILNDFGSGECWEESFRLPALRNNENVFRDRGDGPDV